VAEDVELRSRDDSRPSAEEMLDRVRRLAGAGARGRHRVYLGMAPGVGKTVAALEELHRRKQRGTDAVVAFVETYSRPQTIAAIGDLEVIPRTSLAYSGGIAEEMDTEAVIRRAPAVALVDELAHPNAPGSPHAKRWEDVADLLNAGITVISTLNVHHLESLADIVEDLTGVPVQDRIPDKVVEDADEVELIDISPAALRQRFEQGEVYPTAAVTPDLQSLFREQTLTTLRDLALRKVADISEQDLEDYMRQHGIEAIWPAGEQVMVCVDAEPRSQILLRRGWHMANRYRTDLVAVFVETPAWAHAAPEAKRMLEENLRLAEDLGAQVMRVPGSDVAQALIDVAREKNVGSIVLGHSRHGRVYEVLRGSTVHRLLRLARGADVHVVGDRQVAGA
jgi:two-component system sensor histidine kinase KdpD